MKSDKFITGRTMAAVIICKIHPKLKGKFSQKYHEQEAIDQMSRAKIIRSREQMKEFKLQGSRNKYHGDENINKLVLYSA